MDQRAIWSANIFLGKHAYKMSNCRFLYGSMKTSSKIYLAINTVKDVCLLTHLCVSELSNRWLGKWLGTFEQIWCSFSTHTEATNLRIVRHLVRGTHRWPVESPYKEPALRSGFCVMTPVLIDFTVFIHIHHELCTLWLYYTLFYCCCYIFNSHWIHAKHLFQCYWSNPEEYG